MTGGPLGGHRNNEKRTWLLGAGVLLDLPLRIRPGISGAVETGECHDDCGLPEGETSDEGLGQEAHCTL
jgi:hypothetical protein